MVLDRGELPPVKTLGVLLCPMEDVFKFQVNQPPEKHEHSKSSFLKKIATLFDPLGLFSPSAMWWTTSLCRILTMGDALSNNTATQPLRFKTHNHACSWTEPSWGGNQVFSDLSTHYWIISAREAIKEWERACMQCKRRNATPAKQIMAPLPELRTRMSLRAFSQTSVEFRRFVHYQAGKR